MNAEPSPGAPLQIRIYLEDTDAGGIVYHASYLRFMERARTEMLRAAGLQQSATFNEDLSFVLHAMELRFERAAKLDDLVEVTCRLGEGRAASITFEQQVIPVGGGPPYCTAQAHVACISLKTGRPRRIPTQLRAALERQTPATG